jgi:hypothetical protein
MKKLYKNRYSTAILLSIGIAIGGCGGGGDPKDKPNPTTESQNPNSAQETEHTTEEETPTTQKPAPKDPSNYKSKEPWNHGELKVSKDGHLLQHKDGSDFFWMGDTAWYLPVKLTKEDVTKYFKKRKEQGFNVITFTAVKSIFNKNAYDHYPFKTINGSYVGIKKEDVFKEFNEDYWEHIDFIIDQAKQNGLYVAFLPAWNMNPGSETPNGIHTNTAAKDYGEKVANRYKDRKNIIWVIGGDSDIEEVPEREPIWKALAESIHNVVQNNHLMTYHPSSHSSSKWFHNETWLDFNTFQSGHCHNEKKAIENIEKDYTRTPNKPILDIEPKYEGIEKCYYYRSDKYKDDDSKKPGKPFTDEDVRRLAYKEIFAGSLGFNYGHNSVWQFHSDKNSNTGVYSSLVVDGTWEERLDSDGAKQMGHLVKLMRSRPMQGRVPDKTIVKSGNAVALKGYNYYFVYLPNGGEVTLKPNLSFAKNIKATWFNPKTGKTTFADNYEKGEEITLTSPEGNNDIVLILDDADTKYKLP